MFRTRQSSEGKGSSFPNDGLFGWNDGGPGANASRIPVHDLRGGGALNRFSPDTEPAYGTPLNVTRSASRLPLRRPFEVCTSTVSISAGVPRASRETSAGVPV